MNLSRFFMTWISRSMVVAGQSPLFPVVGRYTAVWSDGRIPGGERSKDTELDDEVGRTSCLRVSERKVWIMTFSRIQMCIGSRKCL